MADVKILPFDYVSYSDAIYHYISELAKVVEQQKVAVDIDRIRTANAELKTTAQKLNAETADLVVIGANSHGIISRYSHLGYHEGIGG